MALIEYNFTNGIFFGIVLCVIACFFLDWYMINIYYKSPEFKSVESPLIIKPLST